MNNKDRVIACYVEACEKSIPGCSAQVRAIIERHWDNQAEADANAKLSFIAVMRNLAIRNAAFAAEVKALKR